MYPIVDSSRLKYIDSSGSVVLDTNFDHGGEFFEGLASVAKSGRRGFINAVGDIVVPVQFAKTRRFHEGLCGACVGSKWGFINAAGEWVVSPRYAAVGDFSCGLAAVQEATLGKVFYIDASSRIIVKNTGQLVIRNYSESLVPAFDGRKKKHGFFDVMGKWAIPASYDLVFSFSENLAVVMMPEMETVCFINRSNDVVANLPYMSTDGIFSNGRVVVCKRWRDDFLYSTVTPTGELVADFWCARIDRCAEGMFVYKADESGLYGYLDSNMNVVISPRYSQASRFHGELAWVNDGSIFGYIDKKGDYVWRG